MLSLNKRSYSIGRSRRRFLSWPVIVAVLVVIAAGGYWVAHNWYEHNLGPVQASSQKTVYFTVEKGATVHQIGENLKTAGLIRSVQAFETYVRGRQLFDQLQAGTYTLSPSMSTQQIVEKIVDGDIAKNLFTILPGKTLADIKKAFAAAGYNSSELSVAFNPSTYDGLAITSYLPDGASLEGILYPDSWQKQSDTSAQAIVQQSLEEMQQHLTPDIINGFKARGLSVYQGLTLASIVYQESGDPEYEPTIAQVFETRLKRGMPLQSNVTADYASDLAGVARTVAIDSPYNTYLHKGLPPGPISNFTDGALKAVAHPSDTDYLYFIAGDDGKVHFTHTEAEHEQAIQKYCTKACS